MQLKIGHLIPSLVLYLRPSAESLKYNLTEGQKPQKSTEKPDLSSKRGTQARKNHTKQGIVLTIP